MSVGRVEMYNFSTCINELCWADGFKKLTFNSASKKQLKFLDKNKYIQMARLKHKIGANIEKGKNIDGGNNTEIYDYYKPFSYYYQVGEKKQIKK